jgi:hypothetical protein
VEPYSKDSVAQVSASLAQLKVSGHILDRSLLKAITVNGDHGRVRQGGEGSRSSSRSSLGVRADKEIVVQAIDLYDNLTSVALKVERSEGIAPEIMLTAPDGFRRIVSSPSTAGRKASSWKARSAMVRRSA